MEAGCWWESVRNRERLRDDQDSDVVVPEESRYPGGRAPVGCCQCDRVEMALQRGQHAPQGGEQRGAVGAAVDQGESAARRPDQDGLT